MAGVPLIQKHSLMQMIRSRRKDLGKGTYGSCLKTFDPFTQQVVVVKTFADASLESLVKEALTLKELQVLGVQCLVGVCVESRQLVTPYAGVTVDQYINTAPSFANVINVALQVARTLQRVIQQGYTHNDLKENNVCVCIKNSFPVVTVIDVGLATRLGSRLIFGNLLEPDRFLWIAPELLMDTHPSSEASDVYGLADLLHTFGLKEGRSRCPSMGALLKWKRQARSRHPGERPTLAAVIQILETLHKEAALPQFSVSR